MKLRRQDRADHRRQPRPRPRARARARAARGARSLWCAATPRASRQRGRELRAARREAYALAADVATRTRSMRIAGQAAALLGPVDVLVHNASTLGPTPLRALLDTRLRGLRARAAGQPGGARSASRKALAGAMALRGRGLVVHVSSDAAAQPYPSWGAYGVSKAALDHLSRSLAAELADTGVRVAQPRSRRDGHRDARATRCPSADPSTLLAPSRSPRASCASRRCGLSERCADPSAERRHEAASTARPRPARRDAAARGRRGTATIARGERTSCRAGSTGGDVLVVNDAATLPASLARQHRARRADRAAAAGGPFQHDHARGVLLGAGDFHTRTELRAPPPEVARVTRCGSAPRALGPRARRGCRHDWSSCAGRATSLRALALYRARSSGAVRTSTQPLAL